MLFEKPWVYKSLTLRQDRAMKKKRWNAAGDIEAFKTAINKTPYYKTISMELLNLDREKAVMVIHCARKHINPFGTVHGGALASLINASCGFAVLYHLNEGEDAITISLSIEFVAPVIKGDITAQARLIQRGRRLARAEAFLTDRNGRLVAKGHTAFIVAAGQ